MTPVANDEPQWPTLAVGAVIVENDHLLLVKRGIEPGAGLWAVPGGRVEWGETLAGAVRREVHEETGLNVGVGDLVWSGEIIDVDGPAPHHFVILDFAAVVVGGDLAAGDDAADVAWIPLDEVKDRPMPDTMFSLIEVLGV